MVERMLEYVKGEFNTEAKKIKTEIEKMLKAVAPPAENSSVNNAVDAKKPETETPKKPAATPRKKPGNKRGNNKENNAVAEKTEESTESKSSIEKCHDLLPKTNF